jgi:AraC-like DNA-binding protein
MKSNRKRGSMACLSLAARLKNIYASRLAAPSPHWPADIQEGFTHINLSLFSTEYSIRRMKEQCSIDSRNFSARFHNHVGYSPRGYITRHRINLAKLLLKERQLKNLPVTSLGHLVGFENPSTFSMTFRNHVGASPKQWRKKVLSKREENV